jgi:mono/diheme cytochrome c family protein
MHGLVRHRAHVSVVGAALALALGCTAGDYEDRAYAADGATSEQDDAGTSVAGQAASAGPDAGARDAGDELVACSPPVASDAIPARSTVMARSAASGGPAGVFTADLFGLFQSSCGGCHVDNALGDFQVSLLTFSSTVTAEALERITSDDPERYMPPAGAGGAPFSKRTPGDPIRELATLLEAWVDAGRPADVFYPTTDAALGGSTPFALSQEVGSAMTNIGNCIPPAPMFARAQSDAAHALDAMFEEAEVLPDRLEQTDLTSLDAETLAEQGVIAFAPAYTLWADDAKKLRMVRVPIGTSLVFDAEEQLFDIPTNTRLYKTFLKRVVDRDGNTAYRKIETRVIVTRPDEELPDGSVRTRALFGTYAWNEEETEALLVRDPLRNGEPFRDRTFTYVTDERAAEAVITTGPDNLQTALEQAGLTRTYAIPGSERCIQCHMGAPGRDFALALTPLQLLRRPLDEGGVIEPAERDEQNQLRRFIDYGLITRMESPDDVVRLEDSQGDREPRNDFELQAQGYMLGNCAHCHNPRGFPSRIAPELRDVLDFYPSEDGGIFQFPLERTSPRIFRGPTQSEAIPYITPSLLDHEPGVQAVATASRAPFDNYSKALATFLEDDEVSFQPIYAPWRSLIYRNVDAPFTYGEDYAIYPRMPFNTPGYDCRVRQILGTWMASIPARLKAVERPPSAVTEPTPLQIELTHPEPQPYEEITPDDPEFSRQVRVALGQVKKFQNSVRYDDCPDELDTVDPGVLRGDRLVPQPMSREVLDDDGNVIAGYSLLAPERPHYAITDLTEPAGDWYPRRPDWKAILVGLELDGLPSGVRERIEQLSDVVITEALRQYALTERAFGLWKVQDDCDLDDLPTVESLAGDARPRWVDVVDADGGAAVYEIAPGAQVFGMICANCHGPLADSKGRLAATIADITGGQTRVANLRDGIFGPVDDPGANRARAFGDAVVDGQTVDDVAARYMAFMGLGGTQRTIPQLALETIRNSRVLGEERPNPTDLNVSSANMLSVPLALCRSVLPSGTADFVLDDGDLDYTPNADFRSALIERNGDLELWRALCSLDNEPMPVRVVKVESTGSAVVYRIRAPFEGGLRHAGSYPADARVGTPRGDAEVGIDDDNAAPWCVQRPGDEALRMAVESAWAEHVSASELPPYCPDAFLDSTENAMTADEAERWATRGAINAGLAVFVYLDALARGEVHSPVPYDRCDEL